MKVRSSLRSAKKRHKSILLVKRHGKVYLVSKTNPKYKVRQG